MKLMDRDLKQILDFLASDKYSDVLTMYENLPKQKKKSTKAMMAKAHALYELSDDIGAIKSYLKVLEVHPNTKARSSVLFNIALCLKNLSMHEEALVILKKLDEDYPNLAGELSHGHEISEKQAVARKTLEHLLD